jgi:hypothetical protein
MVFMRRLFLTAALLLSAQLPASAIVFWNLGNDANQTDPGTGAPWNSVAKVVNSDNSSLSGSAVYLGNGFLLTANHVTVNSNFSQVTFDNTNFFSIDPNFGTYGTQVAPGVDMKVIKLTLNPAGVNAVTLLGLPFEQIAPATIVGWGKGRDPSAPLASTNVAWGTPATATKRWGLNEPKLATNISYPHGTNLYLYSAIVTYAGSTNSANPAESGLGDSEASVAEYDSGSGLFQQIGNQWYLVGITAATEDGGSTDFGIDSTNPAGRGDADYFARISSYDEQITALVPEPSTVSLLVLSGVAAAAVTLRRRR